MMLVGLVAGCTQAPAPCVRATDCVPGVCVNGACVEPPPPDMGDRLDGRLDEGLLDGGLLDGGRTDRGDDPVDLGPDVAPGCEGLELRVTLPADLEPLRRNEPVQLTVTHSPGAIITYESSAGGAFVEDPTGARWIARDEVPWPWRSGPVQLSVRAELDDCQTTRQAQVVLLGDLLMVDGVNGQARAIGSDGTDFGQWRVFDGSGVSAVTLLPDGGFLASVRGPIIGDTRSEPELLRLDADGQEIARFATFDDAGERLFNRAATHLHVVGDEVVAVNGHDDFVHWFSLDGAYLRSVETDGVWAEAAAPWGDDQVVVSRNRERRVRTVRDGQLTIIAEVDREVYGLYPLRDGAVAVVQNAGANAVDRLQPSGQILDAVGPPGGYSINALTPFDEGYVAISRSGSWLIELDAELTPLPGEGFKFSPFGALNPRALIWLNR